jgi:hypothetical protein
MLRPTWVITKMSNVMRVIIKGSEVHIKSVSAVYKYKLQAIFRRVRKLEKSDY